MLNRLKSLFILFILTLCLENSEGGLSVESIACFGNENTTISCREDTIEPGDAYTWLKDSSSIYSYSVQGTLQSNKYNGTTQRGKIMLDIINTNVTDEGEYKCSHKFIDAIGRLSVVIKAGINVTGVSSNNTNLNLTALGVYPNTSIIDRVECSKPDSTSKTFSYSGNQTTTRNTTYPYLYDIKWVGWSDDSKDLTGNCKCIVFIRTALEYNETIYVPFVGGDPQFIEWQMVLPVIISTTIVLTVLVLIAWFCLCKKHSAGKRLHTLLTEGSGRIITCVVAENTSTRERSESKIISVDGNDAGQTHPCIDAEPHHSDQLLEQEPQNEQTVVDGSNAGQTHPCFDAEPHHSDPLIEQEPQKEQTVNCELPNKKPLISCDDNDEAKITIYQPD